MDQARGRFRVLTEGAVLVASGMGVIAALPWAPMAVAVLVVAGMRNWRAAWGVARGTALRGSLVWVAVAIGLGLLAQVVALTEPPGWGRPWTARITYVMVLAILAGL